MRKFRAVSAINAAFGTSKLFHNYINTCDLNELI